jgi:hypothetical protein
MRKRKREKRKERGGRAPLYTKPKRREKTNKGDKQDKRVEGRTRP